MTIVSAFLLPGNPLPLLKGDNPPWKVLADAARKAGDVLQSSKPDVLLIYSTQWIAVLDELWQTRPHSVGRHVDENWYEYGDLQMNLRSDVDLARACIAAATADGVRSKAVDYDHFPIDTGTIVANAFINPDGRIPAVVAANNVYHDFALTMKLGGIAAAQAKAQNKRAAVIAIGGLSGSYFDHEIDIAKDHVVRPEDDAANRAFLERLGKGSGKSLPDDIAEYAKAVKADMGGKHLAWILGATGGFRGASVLGYGATYGAGGAVVQFQLN
jgi:2-aminophenol/2-amino-5-chlorophenol 1,6-dioxygenase alpha subunit